MVTLALVVCFGLLISQRWFGLLIIIILFLCFAQFIGGVILKVWKDCHGE
jgi:hypothetical protein